MHHYWYWTFPSFAWAAGTAHIYSNCPETVWYASTPTGNATDIKHLVPLPAAGYSESYYLDGGGISIKVGLTDKIENITQLEYTWTSTDNMIFYDLSNIDGNPFAMLGAELIPSVSAPAHFPTCLTVTCPAGQSRCDAVYNKPDDVRTLVCAGTTDLTLTLCPDRSTKRALRSHISDRNSAFNAKRRH